MKKAPSISNRPAERGFTLLEALVVLFGAMMLSVALLPNYETRVGEDRSQRTIIDTKMIGDAAKSWLFANGSWPDQANACVGALAVMQGAGLLAPSIDATNPFQAGIAFTCDADTFTITQDVAADWVGILVNALPVTLAVDADTIRTTFPIPGNAPSQRRLMYSQTGGGANRMETDLTRGKTFQNIRTLEVDGTATVTGALVGSIGWHATEGNVNRMVTPFIVGTGGTGATTSMIIDDPYISCAATPGKVGLPANYDSCVLRYGQSSAARPYGAVIKGDLTAAPAGAAHIINNDLKGDVRIVANEMYISRSNNTNGDPNPLSAAPLIQNSRRYVKAVHSVDFSGSLSNYVPIPSCPAGYAADVDPAPRVSSFCQDVGGPDSFSVAVSGGYYLISYSPPTGGVCAAADYPRGSIYTYCAR